MGIFSCGFIVGNTVWAPALLVMQLNDLLWRDRSDIGVGELWKMLCTYCYLPRLASFDVLQNTIMNGVSTDRFFGYADGFADGKYLNLSFNHQIGGVDRSGILVKADVAMRQKLGEKPEVPPATPPVTPPAAENCHFSMVATLDTTRRSCWSILKAIIWCLKWADNRWTSAMNPISSRDHTRRNYDQNLSASYGVH